MENHSSQPKLEESAPDWTSWLNTTLRREIDSLDTTAADIKTLAASALRLSNHYVSNPLERSPWQEPWAIQALLAYYHPLNLSRASTVGRRGQARQFFSGFTDLVDIGCGSGAASLGLRPFAPFERVHLFDRDHRVVERAARLHASVSNSDSELAPPAEISSRALNLQSDPLPSFSPRHLIVLSYVLTELQDERESATLIRRLTSSAMGGLVIIEPSTSDDARKLQRLRHTLQEAGFYIWAPCTHAEECPLLLHSEKDWCHDRTVPLKPDWWEALESRLPIKNETVTFSYLLARREPPPKAPDLARVTGDTLIEKGKNRQLLCRSSSREFLSWFPQRLTKQLADFRFERGDLFQLGDNEVGEKRGSANAVELRIKIEALERLKTLLQR